MHRIPRTKFNAFKFYKFYLWPNKVTQTLIDLFNIYFTRTLFV